MKIAYCMATRGAPRRAAAAIEIAHALESELNEIMYLIAADWDDVATWGYFGDYAPPSLIKMIVETRSPSIGALWNRLAKHAINNGAEALVILGDDNFVTTPAWDEGIAQLCPSGSVGVFAWTDLGSANQPTNPIISKDWYNLYGDVYPEYFPFWFVDTWLAEVWSFTSGEPIQLVPQLILTGKKGKTKRLKDLAFWWEFFVATRPERLAKAAEIRTSMGHEPMSSERLSYIISMWEKHDSTVIGRIPDHEAKMADGGDPGPEYNEALMNAVNHLAKLKERAA